VYVMLRYARPLNGTPALNFINGPASTGLMFGAATLVLLVGRRRQLRTI
jgi:MYXO-CTERM domain-containing protein